MQPSKDEIKAWLKRFGRSREWLAEQCDKSKNTVNNWLSTNIEIPAATLHLISRLMEDDQRAETERVDAAAPKLSHVVLRITTDELNEWSRAFKASNASTLEDWALEAIRGAYSEDQAQKQSLKKGLSEKEAQTVLNQGAAQAPVVDADAKGPSTATTPHSNRMRSERPAAGTPPVHRQRKRMLEGLSSEESSK